MSAEAKIAHASEGRPGEKTVIPEFRKLSRNDTCLFQETGGNLGKPGTFLEIMRDIIGICLQCARDVKKRGAAFEEVYRCFMVWIYLVLQAPRPKLLRYE